MTEIIRINNKAGIQGVVIEKGIAVLNTIENPWVPSPYHKGGLNFKSCVPNGTYEAIPTESRFGDVFCLYNPDLNVYQTIDEAAHQGDGDPHRGGRWACLFGHVANTAQDVSGCVGLGLGWYETMLGVAYSKRAVERFKRLYNTYYTEDKSFTIEIGEYNEQ